VHFQQWNAWQPVASGAPTRFSPMVPRATRARALSSRVGLQGPLAYVYRAFGLHRTPPRAPKAAGFEKSDGGRSAAALPRSLKPSGSNAARRPHLVILGFRPRIQPSARAGIQASGGRRSGALGKPSHPWILGTGPRMTEKSAVISHGSRIALAHARASGTTGGPASASGSTAREQSSARAQMLMQCG